MTKTMAAAGLLEIEAIVMNARAQLLQAHNDLFIERLIEARTKLGAFTSHLLADDDSRTELFLADPGISTEPNGTPALDAVGQHANDAAGDSTRAT